MKKLLMRACVAAVISTPVFSVVQTEKKVLYGGVAAGACYSFLYWAPTAFRHVVEKGFVTSITTSTLVPRLCLDVATVAACVVAWQDCTPKEIFIELPR